MSGEIAKLRYLALPRWTAASVLGIALVVGAALLAFPPSRPEDFAGIPAFAVGTAFGIAAIVFAVWVASLEFGAGTLQRTLTAEPNRHRVLAFETVGFGRLTHDLAGGLAGDEAQTGLVLALLGSLAWVVIVLIPGWLRFVRGDLK